MQIQKPREIAARVLQQRQQAADYVENLLEARLPSLSPADRGLCQELVYGVVRWQRTLDWLIARKTESRTQKATLQILLRFGLYQIFWLDRVPDHAAVNETVELARQLGFGPQSGFVNALLRAYVRERGQTTTLLDQLKVAQPALAYSHPDWLCERWQQRWGVERLRQLLAWNNTAPKAFARRNALRIGAGKLLDQWRDEEVDYDFFRRDWLEENLVFELKSHPPLVSLPSFQQGLFYVQDPSTLLAVHELDPQPGETVFDLCAAPGGKTTYIAQLMQNHGRLVAADGNGFRLQRLRENCARLGVSCVETPAPLKEVRKLARTGPLPALPSPSPIAPLPSDGRAELEGEGESSDTGQRLGPERRSPARGEPRMSFGDRAGSKTGAPGRVEGKFDRVLVDAPCSNTGAMRRRVELRWRIRPEEIDRLRSTQLELLREGAARTRLGGVLVYSTCSLEPEENSRVVKEFLASAPDFDLETERELLPFADGVDGAYVARLRRRARSSPS